MDRHIQVARDLAQATQGGVDASGYRTRWLIAHNRLHEILHAPGPLSEAEKAKQLKEYSEELRQSDEIASRPA